MTKATRLTLDAQIFGRIIRRLRLAQGWTVIECARRCGIHKNHMSQLELGKNTPNINTLFNLAELFRVDPAEIVHEMDLARRSQRAARAAAMLAAAGLDRPEPFVEAEPAREAEPSGDETR